MGRYYYSNNFEGKFTFAVQASDDPETVFGMKDITEEAMVNEKENLEGDDEPSYGVYLAKYRLDGRSKVGEIMDKLDEFYNKLGVENEDRIYSIKSDDELYDFYDKILTDKIFTTDESQASNDRYALNDGKTGYPRQADSVLNGARILLGLRIVSDLILDGYCDMDAEY